NQTRVRNSVGFDAAGRPDRLKPTAPRARTATLPVRTLSAAPKRPPPPAPKGQRGAATPAQPPPHGKLCDGPRRRPRVNLPPPPSSAGAARRARRPRTGQG